MNGRRPSQSVSTAAVARARRSRSFAGDEDGNDADATGREAVSADCGVCERLAGRGARVAPLRLRMWLVVCVRWKASSSSVAALAPPRSCCCLFVRRFALRCEVLTFDSLELGTRALSLGLGSGPKSALCLAFRRACDAGGAGMVRLGGGVSCVILGLGGKIGPDSHVAGNSGL